MLLVLRQPIPHSGLGDGGNEVRPAMVQGPVRLAHAGTMRVAQLCQFREPPHFGQDSNRGT
jgi:hypothetical protein